MKIKKSVLKQMIVEEVRSDPELLAAVGELTKAIEALDVSIDYLTSAMTDEDPFTANLLQKGFGRFVRPGSKKKEPVDESDDLSDLADISEKELTPAEYKQKKKIAAAIKRDDPTKSDSERYAIATAAAKKSANKK